MSSTSISDYISKCTPSKRIEDHHPSTSSLDCHLSDHVVKLLHNATGGFWFDVEQLGNIKIHKIEVERKIAVLNLLKEILHHPSFCPTFIILTMDQLLQLQLATKQTESRSRDFIFNFFKFCRNNWRSFRKAASTRCFWNSSPGSRIPINPRPILPRRAHTMVTLTCQGWLVIGMVHPLIVFADNAVVLALPFAKNQKLMMCTDLHVHPSPRCQRAVTSVEEPWHWELLQAKEAHELSQRAPKGWAEKPPKSKQIEAM